MTDLMDKTAPVFGETDGSVGWIRLNRPDRRNALTGEMWERVAALAEYFDGDNRIRVICLGSAVAGSFAAGADIAELQSIAGDPDLCEANRLAIRRGQRTLARTLTPTVAVIDGPCMGGGCGLALHCDFRLASDRSSFAVTPAKLGLVYPRSDLKRMYDIIGGRGARQLLLKALPVDADVALKIGLVDEVVSPDGLLSAVRVLTNRLSELSPYAIRAIKDSLIAIEDGAVDDDEASAKAFVSAHQHPEGIEGLTAFLEKRKPQF